MKPYEPVQRFDCPFEFLDGSRGYMNDIVGPEQRERYVQEIKLIQVCLGVSPDGIIGPLTRRAALRAYDATF